MRQCKNLMVAQLPAKIAKGFNGGLVYINELFFSIRLSE